MVDDIARPTEHQNIGQALAADRGGVLIHQQDAVDRVLTYLAGIPCNAAGWYRMKVRKRSSPSTLTKVCVWVQASGAQDAPQTAVTSSRLPLQSFRMRSKDFTAGLLRIITSAISLPSPVH
ncbi:MAG: hypothetical protein R3E89_14510 [Thiolinea sp.]